MFDALASQAEFLAKAAKLDPIKLGLRADPASLEMRASYISDLTKLIADHIESLMADASASLTVGHVDEGDARAIADMGDDCAAQLLRAADLTMEAA